MSNRIVIDYSTACQSNGLVTGIPRTVEAISKSLCDIKDIDVIFVDFCDDKSCFYEYNIKKSTRLSLYKPYNNDYLLSLGAPWAFENYLQELQLLKKRIHSFSFLVYDLIPYLFPHFYKDSEFGKYYFNFIYGIISLSDIILSISEHSKSDIIGNSINSSQLPPIHVLKLGCELNQISNNYTTTVNVPTNDFMLCVGTIEFRKNQSTLIKAYKQLCLELEDPPNLFLVGKLGWLNNHIDYQIEVDPILRNKVFIFNEICDNDLVWFYENCLFTLYPSRYEGWGLPIAESLNYGKSVICSNTSSMKEIAPDLCFLLNPLYVGDWVQQMKELSTNHQLRQSRESKIKSHSVLHTWSKTSIQILELLDLIDS